MSRLDRSLESAWGAHVPVDPMFALREAVEALELGRLPSQSALRLLAAALRKCLDGERDLWSALGIKVRRGGRHETPEGKRAQAAKAEAAAAALRLMPGDSMGARAAALQQLLSPEGGVALSLATDQLKAVDEAKSAGLGGMKARALLRNAERADLSSK